MENLLTVELIRGVLHNTKGDQIKLLKFALLATLPSPYVTNCLLEPTKQKILPTVQMQRKCKLENSCITLHFGRRYM